MLEQGIEVEALHFTTVFCRCGGGADSCGASLKTLADNFKIKIKNINNTLSMLEIIKKPKHGYGKNMNPCIDCRINMLKAAKKYMAESGASFLVTGEVLGQRPMSQHLRSLNKIEKETGLQGLILRPLSAQLLDPTIPEKNKWVDRDKLLKISGRSRKEQIAMWHSGKEAWNFEKDYPCPAGGCLLTDINYSALLEDLMEHTPDFALNDILLLGIGRHFRLNDKVKLIVGRKEKENQTLENLARPDDQLLLAADFVGPVSLLRGPFKEEEIQLSAAITARYADTEDKAKGNPPHQYIGVGVKIEVRKDGSIEFLNNIVPLTDSEINIYRINSPQRHKEHKVEK